MRVVWGRASSSNVMKVLWLLDELALPFERRNVGGTYGGTATAEYRAMQPLGLVPAFQEDGFSLWESNAILRYVAATTPGAEAFWPPDARSRAGIDAWMDAQQTVLTRPQSTVFQGLVRQAPEQRDMTVIRAAMTEADRAWRLLDSRIASLGEAYVCGPALTLADICWGVHAHRWFNLPIERTDLPILRAWYERLLQRPAYATHCAGPII